MFFPAHYAMLQCLWISTKMLKIMLTIHVNSGQWMTNSSSNNFYCIILYISTQPHCIQLQLYSSTVCKNCLTFMQHTITKRSIEPYSYYKTHLYNLTCKSVYRLVKCCMEASMMTLYSLVKNYLAGGPKYAFNAEKILSMILHQSALLH